MDRRRRGEEKIIIKEKEKERETCLWEFVAR